jgi:hypothetical protein
MFYFLVQLAQLRRQNALSPWVTSKLNKWFSKNYMVKPGKLQILAPPGGGGSLERLMSISPAREERPPRRSSSAVLTKSCLRAPRRSAAQQTGLASEVKWVSQCEPQWVTHRHADVTTLIPNHRANYAATFRPKKPISACKGQGHHQMHLRGRVG